MVSKWDSGLRSNIHRRPGGPISVKSLCQADLERSPGWDPRYFLAALEHPHVSGLVRKHQSSGGAAVGAVYDRAQSLSSRMCAVLDRAYRKLLSRLAQASSGL